MSRTMRAVAVALTLCLAPALAAEPIQNDVGGQLILATGSSWRYFIAWKTELVRTRSGELKVLDSKPGKEIAERSSMLPPPNWADTGFDDGSWARTRGPIPASSSEMVLLCLRGKFRVRDVAKAGDLRLSLEFVGGAVVYLNGREVARKSLPDGKLEADTPGEDYPEDAYLDPDGFLYMNTFGDPEKYRERLRSRVRNVREVVLPADALKEGTNVLAVEIHRAPASELLLTGKTRKRESWRGRGLFWWPRLGFETLRLTAHASNKVVSSNVSRPAGFRVWNHPICEHVRSDDCGDPVEPLRPVTVSGPRGSVLAGQLVAGSSVVIKSLKVTVSDLKAGNDHGLVPASAVQISYLLPDGHGERGQPKCYETLQRVAPAEIDVKGVDGAIQPIWLSVRVPRDAVPGDYAGRAIVSAEGVEPVEVPLRLKVHAWTMPESKGFVSHVGLIQSPESVALQYETEMWSERHWKLLERSFELMGQVGSDCVFIYVMRRTHFGNQHGMIRWIKKEGGGYTYDFSIAEKYLNLAMKHLGRPEVVAFYCWEAFVDSPKYGDPDPEKKGMPFTILDPKTGRLEEGKGPKPGTAEAREFLKPVVDGMRDILKKRGIEKSLMFGVSTDAYPTKEFVLDLKAIAPNIPWVSRGHVRPSTLYNEVPVSYVAEVWGSPGAPDPSVERRYGWQNPWLRVAFPRAGNGTVGAMRPWAPLAMYYASLEGMQAAGIRGFGSMGADFWEVLKPSDPLRSKYSKAFNIIGRYPESQYGQVYMGNSSPSILSPGPDGALSTVRFEMIRAVAQQVEARIFIEKVLTDPVRKAKLTEELVGRAQRLLDERTRVINWSRPDNWAWFVGSGWQGRDNELYATAAEVAAVAGSE